MARSWAASTITASSGSRSQMKLTTHPSQACVETMTQSSQLIDNVFMGYIVSGGCDSHTGEVYESPRAELLALA